MLAAFAPAGAATLDLAGTDRTLPQPPYFGNRTFLNGATDNVTNNGAGGAPTQAATLTEFGGPPGTAYAGVISDGTARTGLIHSGGSLLLAGANTFSGGFSITGGTVVLGANQTLGATGNAVTVSGAGTLGTGATTQVVQSLTLAGNGAAVVNNGGTFTAGTITLADAGTTLTIVGRAAGLLTNAGAVGSIGVYTGAVVSNTGAIGNAGLWLGGVTSNTGAIGNVGVWTGNVAQNAGNIGNNGTWNGSIVNAAAGILATANGSVITDTVSNAGRVFAFGGTFKGAISNSGSFILPGAGALSTTPYGAVVAAATGGAIGANGAVASLGAFTNASSGLLYVGRTARYSIAGALTNQAGAGSFGRVINAGAMTATLVNAGLTENAATGAWTGGVTNTGVLRNDGAWTGTLDNQAGGVFGNAAGATWTGAIANENGGSLFSAGTLAGGLNNAGRAYLNGGTVNGGVANTGLLDVAGVVTSDSGFTNGGVLAVTNGGSFTLASGSSLSNRAGAAIFVDTGATLTDDLVNNGVVTNFGVFNAAAANASGGTIFNSGVWNGGVTNAAGGSIYGSGSFNGNVVNNGAFASNGARISGDFTNAGYLGSTTTTIGGTLTNTASGVIDLTTGGSTANTLSATRYDAVDGSKAIVNVDLSNAGTGTADHFVFQSTGGAGHTDLTLVNVGGDIGYHKSISLVSVASGQTSTFEVSNLKSLNQGIVFYTYNDNDGTLTGNVNPVKTATPAIQVASVVTTLNSDFFQDWQPFITAPQDPDPNSISGGPWVRGKYGTENVDATAFQNGNTPTASRVSTEFSGFQVGADVGMFNINKSGWNLIAGVTGGEVFANAVEKLAGSTKGNFDIPFVGFYTAATNGPFHADLLYRHDFYTIKFNDSNNGLVNSALAANGDSVSMDAGYSFGLGTFGTLGNFFIEPNGSLIVSNVSVNRLVFPSTVAAGGTLGTLKTNDIDSVLGRAGFRFGTSLTVDKLALQPFMTAAVWHEFDGNATSVFTPSGGGLGDTTPVGLSVTRVGTFGQFGVGLNGELLGSNILGTIRADFRVGDKVDGQSVTAQLRYQF